MKVSYDPRYNIAYIRLREKAAEVEIIRISDEIESLAGDSHSRVSQHYRPYMGLPEETKKMWTLGAVPIKRRTRNV